MRGFHQFQALLSERWAEACEALQFFPPNGLTWDIGEYPHFKTKRGHGVTFLDGPGRCHVRFAEKLMTSPQHRQDGIIRHELGHVFDMLIPRQGLDAWAAGKGVFLAKTQERRADDIAKALWGTALRYDADLVQSTKNGVRPRPEHLGL